MRTSLPSHLLVGLGVLVGSSFAIADESPDSPEVIAEIREQRLEKNPRDESAWADLIQARLDLQDYAHAEKALGDWESKVPSPSPTLIRLRGELAFSRDDFSKAIEQWTRYRSLAPTDSKVRSRLVDAYEAQRNWEKAVIELTAIIKAEPSAANLGRRAALQIRRHHWDEADADLREGNGLDATDSSIQKLFPIFERSKTWLVTVKKLDAAIEKDPKNITLLLNRAEWFAGIGLIAACTDDVEAAFAADPKSLRAKLWRGILAWEREAREAAGDVMELRLKDVRTKFQVELKAVDASADPEARAAFLLKYQQPVLALGEVDHLDGSPNKARALFTLGRLTEAGVAARRATELHPADATAWFTLAQVEVENGNINEAIDDLKRSTALTKNPAAEELRKDLLRRLSK